MCSWRSRRLSMHDVELFSAGPELPPVIGDEARELFRDTLDATDEVAQRLAALIEVGEQQVAVGDQLVDLPGVVREGVRPPSSRGRATAGALRRAC